MQEATSSELLAFAGVGVAFIGPENGTIVSCNPAYASLLGSTPRELAGRSFFEFLDTQQETKARWERELRLEGIASVYEVTITTDNGSERCLLATGVPLPVSEGGSYRGAVQTIQDITEKRRAEEALRESEERRRLVDRATKDMVWDVDLAADCQVWDGAAEEAFGYPAGQITDTAWWEKRVHPDDRERVLGKVAVVLRPGGGDAWSDQYRFLRADGSYACVEDRAFVARDEATDRAVRMVGSMKDVTGQKRAEEALRESERRHGFAFEEAPVGMARLSLDGGRYLAVNSALCGMLGYSQKELLAEMTWQDVTHPDDLKADVEQSRRMLAGEISSYSLEKRYLRSDRRAVWARLSVWLRRKLSGEPECFESMVEDITERKLRQLVPEPLTDRELEVLHLASEGRTSREIARELRYSASMIDCHVGHANRKLGVKSRKEAVRTAVEIGLLPALPR
jgi:PAS domain S-box-containing protein